MQIQSELAEAHLKLDQLIEVLLQQDRKGSVQAREAKVEHGDFVEHDTSEVKHEDHPLFEVHNWGDAEMGSIEASMEAGNPTSDVAGEDNDDQMNIKLDNDFHTLDGERNGTERHLGGRMLYCFYDTLLACICK